MKKIINLIAAASIVSATIATPMVSAYNVTEDGEYSVSFSYNIYSDVRDLCEETDCGKAYTLGRQTRELKLNVEAEDTVEIGSLLTDLGMTRDEVEKPVDFSKNSEYSWQVVGGDGTAVETLTLPDFGEKKAVQLEAVFGGERTANDELVLRVNRKGAQDAEGQDLSEVEDIVFQKKDFQGYTLPVLTHEGWEFKGWSRLSAEGEKEEFDGQITAESFAENGFLEVHGVWENGETEGLVDEQTGAEISFGSPVPLGSKLSVANLEAEETLKDEAPATLKQIYDISVVADDSEVPVKNNELLVSIPLAEELANYQYFQVVYIVDGEIKEYLPAMASNGKLLFNTTHLSIYGVQAANKPFSTAVTEEVKAPETGVMWYRVGGAGVSKATVIAAAGSICVIMGVLLILKNDHKNNLKS